MSNIIQSSRLSIRQFSLADNEFIFRIVNEPSFIENIADKGVRTLADADHYLLTGPIASYEKYGFGLNLVLLNDSQVPIGMCGILKRPELDVPDLGYAFLPEYCSHGYALEAAKLVLADTKERLNIKKLAAVTNQTNIRSIQLLEKLGFKFQGLEQLYPNVPECKLFEYSA